MYLRPRKMSLSVNETGTIEIKIDDLNPVKLRVEVLDGNCWDLTSSLQKLDVVRITSSDNASFLQRKLPICASLKIDEPDFNADTKMDFDLKMDTKTRCLSIMCLNKPRKNMNVSRRHDQTTDSCDRILKKNQDPSRGLIPFMGVVQEHKVYVCPIYSLLGAD